MGIEVRTQVGVPIAADFAPLGNSPASTPLVIDSSSGKVYFLSPTNVVTQIVGSGGVTSIAVTGSNGITVGGSPITTSGTITLALGAITPSSVNASGTLAGSNFSGSSSGANTGDQTITLTGNVTGSGTGSFAATIANSAVTYAKIQNETAATLLGNPTGGATAPSEITLGTNLSFAGSVLNAAAASSPPWPSTTNQIVTATATVTIPTGATRAYVRMVGSGAGGGGGAIGNGGSGGGAGPYAEQWFTGLTPANTLAATVGNAGTGGNANNDGTAGNTVSLASGTQTITTMSCNGGNKGLTAGTGAAAQSTSAGAAVTIPGQGSEDSTLFAGVSVGTSGGSNPLGLGGQAVSGGSNAGTNYGAGGSGGSGSTTGGNGSKGVIIISWYS